MNWFNKDCEDPTDQLLAGNPFIDDTVLFDPDCDDPTYPLLAGNPFADDTDWFDWDCDDPTYPLLAGNPFFDDKELDQANKTYARNTYSTTDTEWECNQTYDDETCPSTSYTCFPLPKINKNHLEAGNRIIMPESTLEKIIYSHDLVYPMVFRIEKSDTSLYSHCGVIEFSADEGTVNMPTWMMTNMKLQEGEVVDIEYTTLPKGTYIKIQPHATKFTTLSDHKSLLENAFRDYACLTTGDTIVIDHEDEKYLIDVLETKPSDAISLFETDLEVDFATPLDYKEPEKETKDDKLFPGQGRRLGGTIRPRDDESFNESNKMLAIKESTIAYKQQTEFKPFMGTAKRMDGQSLAVTTE
ncbi:ubiquitin fusion degradation protein 1, partial [Tanacetum coccineum]